MPAFDASPEIAQAAEAGPHKGWSTFDAKLEGARFHLLHGLVSANLFNAREASRLAGELEELAQSYGYAQADSYLTDASGLSDDEIEARPELAIQKQNLFDDGGYEDQYFVEVRKSEILLAEAAATPEAKTFLGAAIGISADGGTINERMSRAYARGRDMRAQQDFAAPAL